MRLIAQGLGFSFEVSIRARDHLSRWALLVGRFPCGSTLGLDRLQNDLNSIMLGGLGEIGSIPYAIVTEHT